MSEPKEQRRTAKLLIIKLKHDTYYISAENDVAAFLLAFRRLDEDTSTRSGR